MKTVITNNLFWDCECKENYIHLRDAKHGYCHKCNATAEDQPDSRQDEILNYLIGKKVGVKYGYFTPEEKPIVIVLDHVDTTHVEDDEDILWDRNRDNWVTAKYAFENLIS